MAKVRAKTTRLEESHHSEPDCQAVLVHGDAAKADRLAVDYRGEAVRLELSCGAAPLWAGTWDLEVCADGKRLETSSAWKEICWYSDPQMTYLELEVKLIGGQRVQRHLAVAHQDRFVFLADSLLGKQPAAWEYRASLPLSNPAAFEPAEETREGYLCVGRRRILSLPLALPEWRCDPRSGTLDAVDQRLQLCQSAPGMGLFAPLFFDLDGRRNQRPYTWRQLTVAENLQVMAPDVAVGYRVGVGKQQWLVYRSLAEAGNRTVLGHNLITQLLIARFDRQGEVESLVEIE